jgi:hypothetical protein
MILREEAPLLSLLWIKFVDCINEGQIFDKQSVLPHKITLPKDLTCCSDLLNFGS